eukprot:5386584-Prymnesium_polylepis.1
MTAERELLRLLRAVASPSGKDTATSSALHALGTRVLDAASPHLTSPLAPDIWESPPPFRDAFVVLKTAEFSKPAEAF